MARIAMHQNEGEGFCAWSAAHCRIASCAAGVLVRYTCMVRKKAFYRGGWYGVGGLEDIENSRGRLHSVSRRCGNHPQHCGARDSTDLVAVLLIC